MRAFAASGLIGAITLTLLGGLAHAAGEALVEEVTPTRPGLEAMDPLSEGQTIALAKGQKMVVSYLRSCNRETRCFLSPCQTLSPRQFPSPRQLRSSRTANTSGSKKSKARSSAAECPACV